MPENKHMPDPAELGLPANPKPTTPLKRNLLILAGAVLISILIVAVFILTRPSISPPTPITQPSSSSQAATTPASPTPTTSTDPTATWPGYTNSSGGYSLRYNPSWQTKTCPDNPSLLFLAPTLAALGTCQSENAGQIEILSMDGDQRTALAYGSDYESVTTTTVTVDSITGVRESAVARAPGAIGPPAGTILVHYIFFNGSKTFLAAYQQQPSGDISTNVLSDFDLMVKNTFNFI